MNNGIPNDLISLETAASMIAYTQEADRILKIELGVDSSEMLTSEKAELLHKILKAKCEIAFNV